MGLVFHGLMYAVRPAVTAEMFPTRMRYSGVSLGYRVTSIVAGSLAPIIAVRLLETYKSSLPISWYLAATAAVSAVAALAARETKGIDLAAIDLADAERLRGHPDTPARMDRSRRNLSKAPSSPRHTSNSARRAPQVSAVS
jgi:hypothetical protein